jgi:hypothetical protein
MGNFHTYNDDKVMDATTVHSAVPYRTHLLDPFSAQLGKFVISLSNTIVNYIQWDGETKFARYFGAKFV